VTALRTLSDNSDRFAEAGDCSDERAPVDRGYYAIFAVDPDGYRIRSLLWSLGGLRSGLPLICYGAREGRKVCRLAAGGGWIRTISSARADTDVRMWISASKRPSLLTPSAIGR